MKHKLKEKTISIREVHRELRSITEQVEAGQTFLVQKNGKTVFKIVPIEASAKRYRLEDFKKIQFKGEPDLSQKIDEIVYGI